MFHQCGILQDCDVLVIQGYEQFLKALHHHMVMGNVTISQLGQFLILMTYMSFCRMNHYTNYMKDEDSVNLGIAVWLSIVIMAFRTSIHAEGFTQNHQPLFQGVEYHHKKKTTCHHQQISGTGVCLSKSCPM